MVGAVSFILIDCRRRVRAFEVLYLGTAMLKPLWHNSNKKPGLCQYKNKNRQQFSILPAGLIFLADKVFPCLEYIPRVTPVAFVPQMVPLIKNRVGGVRAKRNKLLVF
jgi:hypothetical protein